MSRIKRQFLLSTLALRKPVNAQLSKVITDGTISARVFWWRMHLFSATISKISNCRALYKSEPSIHLTKFPLPCPGKSAVVLGDNSLYPPLEVLSLLLSSHQRRFWISRSEVGYESVLSDLCSGNKRRSKLQTIEMPIKGRPLSTKIKPKVWYGMFHTRFSVYVFSFQVNDLLRDFTRFLTFFFCFVLFCFFFPHFYSIINYKLQRYY